MPSLQSLLVELVGVFGLFMLTVTLWLSIIGVPVLFFLVVRFLWSRTVHVGRSAELEKLIWQLHRIASALEAQQAAAPTIEAQTAPPVERHVALSMFGR